MSIKNPGEQLPNNVVAYVGGSQAVSNQHRQRVASMWEQIKRMYWSPIGMSTTVLHNITILLAVLVYFGWHQVWYGVPAFSMQVVAAKK